MKQPLVHKIVCIVISLCFLLPTILLTTDQVTGDGRDSDNYLYVYREAESWDRSYDMYNGKNFQIFPYVDDDYPTSNDNYTEREGNNDSGDFAEWDFTVHHPDTYHFHIRGWKDKSGCTDVELYWNGSFINSTDFDIGLLQSEKWDWFSYGSMYLSKGIGTLKLIANTSGNMEIDNILITNDSSYDPDGVEAEGSISHDIGKRTPSWGGGITNLDYDYIQSKTENLSDVIFNVENWKTDIEKGRAFGTAGEQHAAYYLETWFKNEIGVHTARERVIAYPGEGIDDKMEIVSMNLTVNDGNNDQYVDDLFTGINSTQCPLLPLDSQDSGNYSRSNLKVRNWYEAHKDVPSFSNNFDETFSNFLDSNASDILNETVQIVNSTNATYEATLFNTTLKYFEEYHNISFSNPDSNNIENWNKTFKGYAKSDVEDYVWIMEDPWNNPNSSLPFPRGIDVAYKVYEIINCVTGKTHIVENHFFKFIILTFGIRVFNGFGWDKCRGIILHDFNNNTHNMINTQALELNDNPDQIKALMGIPLIFINGTVGREINASYEDYTVNFTREQQFNDSVGSENVIGTIYGAEQDKTVILSSLYDSWWNQGTTDSAIGMSIVLAIAKYYKENNIVPRYNLKFVCFSGEEYGLLGAYSYEARHKDEDIVAVIDLNQLGFEERYDIPLNFTVYVNNEDVNQTVTNITRRTDYENRTFNHANFTTFLSGNGAPSNDRPFATKREHEGIQTMCFLKDTGWTLHHRDGKKESTEPHSAGDILTYYNRTYVEVVAEMVLNVTKYFAGETIFLEPGWNLITIPVDNGWMASDLANNVTGCTSVSMWDSVNQSYWTYLPGWPDFDFPLVEGCGYFVDMNGSDTLVVSGASIVNVSVSLEVGWNLIGWYDEDETMASSLAENISGCVSVSMWDSVNQSYWTYLPGWPDFDFTVSRGMGLFVDVNQTSVWYGNEQDQSRENQSGSRNDSNQPDLPHTLYGRAFYKNMTNPADNATITFINLNTSEQFNTTIPTHTGGWYGEDLGQFTKTGWEHGNIIRIIVNGTGNHTGWTGTAEITANNSTSIQQVQLIYVIDNTTPEITNVTATSDPIGLGFNTTITATVTDTNNTVTVVKINITNPENETDNLTMNLTQNNTYQLTYSDTWKTGEYQYFIWTRNDVNNTNTSNMYDFDVTGELTMSTCTLYNSYTENTSLNLTDPPGGLASELGYEFLDDGKVLHIWNKYDSYYFNTSSGIQLTNHFGEYWSRNVLMLGYYNNDNWNVLYRTDELTGFQKEVETDNQTYVNITLWKNLEYNGYEFRLALRYHLGLMDQELTVIPYIKNLGVDIPYELGFAWEITDIQVDMTPEDDYILINDSCYWLNETLDLSFTNLTRPVYCWNDSLNDTVVCGYEPNSEFHIRENLSDGLVRSLYLRWNPDVNYKVWITSWNSSYNAPVVLGIRIGDLSAGESKHTRLYWYDADQQTYYFDQHSAFEGWSSNPSYMVDNQTGNFASTTVSEVERCTSHSCSRGTDLGSISKIEFRALGFRTGGSWNLNLRPVFESGDGDAHQFALPTSAGWSDWFDITSDTNAPESWTWNKVIALDCDVVPAVFHGLPAPTAYCSKVELRVTYTPWSPPCITNPSPGHGSTNASIQPRLGITVSDENGESLNISWLSNCTGEWQVFGTNNSVGNGTYYQTLEGADVNGQWWYWMVNVSDGHEYNESNVFKFYTGVQSKISNSGETNTKGYLRMQVEYWNESEWIVDLVVINDTSPRVVNMSSELGLDLVFNGLVDISDLGYGDGTYRVYAALCDPWGDPLVVGEDELEAWWRFEVDISG